ncbi:MAG: DUF929 family protein [Ktedonobacterales bacterium]
MSKSKRTQRSTPGAKPASSATKPASSATKPASTGASGAARTVTRTTSSVASTGAGSRPASTGPRTASSAATVRRSTGSPPSSMRSSSVARPSTRAQARATYARNRRRGVATPWWKSPWAIVGIPVVAIVLIVAGFFFLGSHGGASGTNAQPVPADVLQGVTTVSAHTFATVGTGEVANPLTRVTPGVPILKDSAGKPIFLYIGAEYCPYCAAERWSMVIALNRFGSFSNLHIISSSSSDVYPNTPTFTFYQSTYTSPYVDFQPVEIYDRNDPPQPLQTMTAAQSQLFRKYDSSTGLPFMDFGNQYIAIGPSYSNDVLTDQDWHSIAKLLNDPSSPVTQSIVGTANYMTAAICQINGNKPANVCGAAPIPAIEKTIGKPAGS